MPIIEEGPSIPEDEPWGMALVLGAAASVVLSNDNGPTLQHGGGGHLGRLVESTRDELVGVLGPMIGVYDAEAIGRMIQV